MSSLDEKRVYEGGGTDAECLLASESGLLQAAVSGDRIGEFGIALQADVRDLAADVDRVVVATSDGVSVGPTPTALDPSGLDGGSAVGLEADAWVAADTDGRVIRATDGELTALGQIGTVRAIDPPLIAAIDGVYRLEGLESVGLEDVHDVAAQPVPRAACEDALYRLGNGWIAEQDGPTTAITGRPGGHVAAVVGGALHQLVDDTWRATPVPVDSPVVDVALGPATYAVTTDGTLCVNAGDGWRTRVLGVRTPRRLVVRPAPT